MRERMRSAAAWVALSALGMGAVPCVAAAPPVDTPARVAVPDATARGIGQARPSRDGLPLHLEIRARDVYTAPGGRYHVMARNTAEKTVVAYGVRVIGRDRHARPRPLRAYVVRPSQPLEPRHLQPVAVPVAGLPPEYDVEATFVVFDDGSWIGDGDRARRELAAMREEYAAAREMAQLLAPLGDAPTRDALVRVTADLSRLLARLRTSGARASCEAVLRGLGVALDAQTARSRSYREAVLIGRDKVDRRIGRYRGLPLFERGEPRA